MLSWPVAGSGLGSEHLITTSAHDQERVTWPVAVDRDDVVGERLVETWRRRAP
jgi:hypothetical protein